MLQSPGDKRMEFETKVSNNPVETLTTASEKRLNSFRLVKLRPEAGKRYGLADIFFAEHIERGPNAPYKYADEKYVDPVGYVIAGKTINVALEDILSDRCYSLNVMSMIKEHQQRNVKHASTNVDTGPNELSFARLLAIWSEDGYVTSAPEGLSVESFFASRPNGEFVASTDHPASPDQ